QLSVKSQSQISISKPKKRRCHSERSSSGACEQISGAENLLYFFFAGVFVAALFLGALAFFFAVGFAAFASALGSVEASFFGFTSFFGSSGAVNFWPSKAISVIRTEENGCRCPASFLYCFFFL